VGPRELTTEDLKVLGQTISRNGVSLWAVIGDSTATQAAAEALGLETTFGPRVTPPPEAASPPRPERDEGQPETKVEDTALRLAQDTALRLAQDTALRLAQDTALGILVHRTLRSGQRSGQVIQHPGHVVIIGDVNPGAEIIAGGDVIVWGKLRGIVHAGATGDDGAVVCALSLTPLQLRIGNHIARAPEGREGLSEWPEMASVQNGEIVAESWEK
jgi:septum site-determining protein MinC